MKTTILFSRAFYVPVAITLFFASCSKEISLNADLADLINASSTIAVESSMSATSSDTVYVVDACSKNERRTAITEANLSATITAYLNTTYGGYTFRKAFSISGASGNVTGFVVIIFYNDKPVGLKFDANGNFVKVLEQREKNDLHGRGFHLGGLFQDRDGHDRDTIALASLSGTILAYMTLNYPSDTLVKAFVTRGGAIIILSKNNGAFATIFNASGNFVHHIELAARSGRCEVIAQGDLSAQIFAYITTTYPNAVFKKAFVIKDGTTVKGYVVVLDANGTKYALSFDASGNFLKAKVIH